MSQETNEEGMMEEKVESEIDEAQVIKNEVKKKMQAEQEYAKKINKVLKNNNKRHLKPANVFTHALEEASNDLQEGLQFLQRLEGNHELVFTEASKYISKQGTVSLLMNHRASNEPIKGHDFQVYLAHVANLHFQKWLDSKGIEETYQIDVRNSNQYPSIFAVYHDDHEIVQFSVLQQFYGMRKKPDVEEVLLEKHQSTLKKIDERLQLQTLKVEEQVSKRDHPMKHYKGIKNKLAYLFMNHQKVYEVFNKWVRREEKILLDLKMEKEREIQSFPDFLERSNNQRSYMEEVEVFFQELGYELMTEEHKLY